MPENLVSEDEVARMGFSANVVESVLATANLIESEPWHYIAPFESDDPQGERVVARQRRLVVVDEVPEVVVQAWVGEDGDWCVWGTHNPNLAAKTARAFALEDGLDEPPSARRWGATATKWWGEPDLPSQEVWGLESYVDANAYEREPREGWVPFLSVYP